MGNIMIFDMADCSGCGNCAMACSFHHKGEFAPAMAAISVLEKEDGPGFRISFVEENDGEKIACIGCGEVKLEVPAPLDHHRQAIAGQQELPHR